MSHLLLNFPLVPDHKGEAPESLGHVQHRSPSELRIYDFAI